MTGARSPAIKAAGAGPIASISRVLERCFDIVINAHSSQKTVRAALVHAYPGWDGNSRLPQRHSYIPRRNAPRRRSRRSVEAHAAAGTKALDEERAELRWPRWVL